MNLFPRRLAALAPVLLLLPALTRAGQVREDDPVVRVSPLRDQVAQILEQPAPLLGVNAAPERAARIAGLGSDVVPVVFDLLATVVGPGAAPASGPGGSLAEETLVLTCRKLGRGVLLRELHARAEASVACGERAAMLRILASLGLAADVKLALDVGAPPCTEHETGDHLLVFLEDAVREMCERDRGALTALRGRLFDQPARVACPLLRAVGCLDSFDALPWLTEVLGWGEGHLDASVLSQICAVGPGMPQPIDENLCREVRGYMEREDPILRRQAIEAVGRLQDFGAIEALLSFLESEDAVDSELAHRALSRMTALNLPPSAQRWRAWYMREKKWYDERAPILINGLRNPNDKTVIPALTEVARYRYERHRLAAIIAPLLEDDEVGIAIKACVSLRELRSPVPLRELVACLESGDEELAAAAHQTLRALTSLDSLPNPEAWEVALAGDATGR